MKKKKNRLNKLFIVLFIAIALLILNNFMIYERGIKVAEAREIAKEELRPAELKITKITLDDCKFCFDVETAIEELKNQNINITEEETFSARSSEGKELISKYNIKKLPTIILDGEINKSKQLITYFEEKGEIDDGSFVYTSLTPPYFDVISDGIKGIVSITHVIDSLCEKCLDLTGVSLSLKNQGVFLQNEESVEYNSKEGQDLIKQFDIKQVPAVLISKEVDYYKDIKKALLQLGAKEKNEFYAVHSVLPPYRDLLKNKIVGLVDVVYLDNDECSTCYDVSVNRKILLNFGMVFGEENTYNINSPEGKQFIQKYKIQKLPIIILSPDAKYYSSFEQVWKNVGTIDDGWFIMRNPELIGTYWDLENNKAVEKKIVK